MKVALITGGEPRFTKYWVENFKRLQDAFQIDLYFYLWKDFQLTDFQLNFSDVEGTVEEKILSILPNNVKLKKIVWVNSPSFNSVLTKEFISKFIGVNSLNTIEVIKKKLHAIFCQRYSIKQCFDLMTESYDFVIRYRLDCYPDKKLYLYDYTNFNGVIIPSNYIHGGIIPKKIPPFNDKFAIGNMENMQIYCNMFDHYLQLLDEEPFTIQEETGLSYHLMKNNVEIKIGNFNCNLVREGYP